MENNQLLIGNPEKPSIAMLIYQKVTLSQIHSHMWSITIRSWAPFETVAPNCSQLTLHLKDAAAGNEGQGWHNGAATIHLGAGESMVTLLTRESG